MDGIKIERAHRSGVRQQNEKERIIVVKFLDWKDKQKVLKNSNKLRDTGIYINEDFSELTMKKRAELQKELRNARAQGKYAYLNVDKLVVREWRK